MWLTCKNQPVPQDLFNIGPASFEFSDDSQVTFEDGGMRFDLRAKPVPWNAERHPAAVFGSDDTQAGQIAPRFRTHGVFHFTDKLSTPQRRFDHPDYDAPVHDFYLHAHGISKGLHFSGAVDLRPDRIELRGLLRTLSEQDNDVTTLHLVRHCTPGTVDLRPHVYRSVQEAQEVALNQVRHLVIREWAPQWADDITGFTQLQSLSLEQRWPNINASATALPETLGNLRSLRQLSLRSVNLQRLPEALGQLQALEELSVEYGQLTEVPDNIGKLRHLKRLTLRWNALRSLPESIGHLPELTLLNIERNRFQSLPASLTNIQTVKVEKRVEALFRDVSYKPEVVVAIDREQFMARSSPAHVTLLRAALAQHQLADYEADLLRHARQALRLVTTDPDDYAAPGRTRIGGAPDLPPDLDYPNTDGRLWHFYAQLDLAALAPLQGWLPRTGTLYFFGEGQEDGDRVSVQHSTAPTSTLRTFAWPDDAEFVGGSDMPTAYRGYQVQVDTTVSVPPLYSADMRMTAEDTALLQIEAHYPLKKTYWALEETLTGNANRQHGAHTLNADVVTREESPQEQAASAYGGLPDEWINLLKLDSDKQPGFDFGGSGTLTFSIHAKDLALGDFSRVHWSVERG